MLSQDALGSTQKKTAIWVSILCSNIAFRLETCYKRVYTIPGSTEFGTGRPLLKQRHLAPCDVPQNVRYLWQI